MQRSLDHLPTSKQNDIAHIVSVIRDEFEQVTGFANGKKKHSRIAKIILFGSFATGKWVNDPAHGYVSDYDILVILNKAELVEDYKLWNAVDERVALRVRPPINILVHTLKEVNNALMEGQYFFSDIKQQGVLLYEFDKTELVQEGNLSAAQYKAVAEKHYKQWFESANGFFKQYQYAIKDGEVKIAAFLLHQVAERLYSCLLLVVTNYKPNTHNLQQLNSLAILQYEDIAGVFPQDTKVQRRRFQLLKKAYVDARYSEHYEITEEELKWLAERVECLQGMVERLCLEKVERLNSGHLI